MAAVEPCAGIEAGACLRLIDSCITQLKAQGPSMTCDESKEEKEEAEVDTPGVLVPVHQHWSGEEPGSTKLERPNIGSEAGSYLRLIDLCIPQL